MVQDLSDLPEELWQTAAWVEHGSLPALRLVSRGWNKAANLAVRELKGVFVVESESHFERLRLVGQRWPNLERLDLDCYNWPADSSCRDLVSYLTPLTRLQRLSWPPGAAVLPEGQEFMLRQTQLLGLAISGMIGQTGVSDGVLQAIVRLTHLTRLDCHLQAEHAHLAGMQPPFQLEPATDEGLRCLSSLQSLEHLTLTFSKKPYGQFTVNGHALSSIGSLHQLTHLCLEAWPMVDTELGHLTHLQLVSLDLNDCINLTPNCMMHLTLITSLRSLSLVGTANLLTRDEREAFERVADELLPHLGVQL